MARLAYPALLAGNAVLTLGPLMVRYASVGPMQSAYWRLVLGAIPLLVLIRLVPSQRPNLPMGRAAWIGLALAGLFFASDLTSWHLGIMRTTIANASLFGNLASFLLVVYGILFLRARPDRRQWLALALAAAGSIFLFGASAEISMRHLAGDLICLGAAVFYTAYFVAVGKVRGSQPALAVLAGASTFGALALTPLVLLSPDPLFPADLAGWWPLIGLGIGSQVIGQGLIVYALAHLPPSVSGIGMLLQPLLSTALGWVMFGEVMGPLEMSGALLILGALVSQSLPARSAPQTAV